MRRQREEYLEAPRFGELSKLLPVFLVVVTIVFLYLQKLDPTRST